jgi:hypothetical protein
MAAVASVGMPFVTARLLPGIHASFHRSSTLFIVGGVTYTLYYRPEAVQLFSAHIRAIKRLQDRSAFTVFHALQTRVVVIVVTYTMRAPAAI